ncbi:MAG TPA: dTDP-4-dehydrorhamnose reductase [Candidatus Agrococcus pullicola]|uniref:dTDP-4-dehydrorhamnose reductase n=1 Tax=Candidatus Agrococcus pullicola TaxID=2838429 RepID=A0A9D1YVI6_9MICO|nr:dTDP-4-dehydrorhamnose reductase [Candidatus Agrococcus pullicola]
MRVLVTGAGGMLARDILEARSGHDLVAVTRAQLDVTDPEACVATVAGFDAVINCAAFTSVDEAETDERTAYAVNAAGAQNLAIAARAVGAVLVQVSTDYVFDGTASSPYREDAQPSPLGAYGRTKAAGESLALAAHDDTVIVRVAWLYGMHGSNFVSTVLRLANERDTVRVVADQRGQPTSTVEAAASILALLDAGIRRGAFHATCAGETTWHGLARETFRLTGLEAERVLPVTSAEFPRPAPRPAYSVLDHSAIRTVRAPALWEDALRRELARMGVLAEGNPR